MADKAELLRSLHLAPPILVLPNAWDAATARVFQAAGFPAVATTSAGVAAALGYADGGAAPANEMIEAIARIARAVRVPVTADIENGYAAAPDAVADMVLRVIAAGAVGINLEDCMPDAPDLIDVTLQADKIEAVVRAAAIAGVRVVVNARTDVFLREFGEPGRRLDVAIDRGKAYREAGADCIFVPGVRDPASNPGMPSRWLSPDRRRRLCCSHALTSRSAIPRSPRRNSLTMPSSGPRAKTLKRSRGWSRSSTSAPAHRSRSSSQMLDWRP